MLKIRNYPEKSIGRILLGRDILSGIFMRFILRIVLAKLIPRKICLLSNKWLKVKLLNCLWSIKEFVLKCSLINKKCKNKSFCRYHCSRIQIRITSHSMASFKRYFNVMDEEDCLDSVFWIFKMKMEMEIKIKIKWNLVVSLNWQLSCNDHQFKSVSITENN